MSDINPKKTAFEAENSDLEALDRLGAAIYFEREFPDIKRAFTDKQKCAVCIDEGVAHKDINGENKFCLAGSGILYPAKDESERLNKVARLFIERGITDITSHGGCGAAGIAFKRDASDADKMINLAEKVENYSVEWANKVVTKIRELGYPAEHTRILASDMERPIEFHNARVVYYDGVGGFNPNKEIGLPMGFVVERAYLPADYAKEELKVAIDIVFGKHGFADLFTSERPLIIIAFALSQENLSGYIDEINSALALNSHAKEGRIKIDGAVIK